MGSQITKIPSICGDGYPGVGYQVDDGDSVRVAMAWPSASAEGWRSLTMEVPKKLSLDELCESKCDEADVANGNVEAPMTPRCEEER